jgi:hypothetical protein
MNNGAEAADQIVNMSLKGIEMLAKITGAGAKNLATYLYAVLKDQKKTKGKTRLEGLLRSGKELKVFAVRNEDLQKFTQEAKRYGVLYCALRDKKNVDGVCDIMVRAEDASKINRIVERFKLATVDTASIKSEIQKSRAEKKGEKAPAEKGTSAEKSTDEFVDELMSKPAEPPIPRSDSPNPTTATTEKSRPSEHTYERNGRSAGDATEQERKSVRSELEEIRQSRSGQAGSARSPAKEQQKTANQSAKTAKPKNKNKKKAR